MNRREALLAAAAAGLSTPALGAEPIPLRPWIGKYYPAFGLNVFRPPDTKIEETPGEQEFENGAKGPTLLLFITKPNGSGFGVQAYDMAASPKYRSDAQRAFDDFKEDFDAVGLHEIARPRCRAWEFDHIANSRRQRTQFLAAPPRYVAATAFGPRNGELDPDTDSFFAQLMFG